MWICPTFQRPDRLKKLAKSWEKHEPGKRLYVRIWDEDPEFDKYLSIKWPRGWRLYVSNAKGAGEALNDFYKRHPYFPYYGFIGDDIVLKTTKGLLALEKASSHWFVSYPNDTIQRHRLPTHFCVGNRLVRVMGGVVPPMFHHNYMDVGLAGIAEPMHLLRYCPEVIFQHNHYINGKAEIDATYLEALTGETVGKSALKEFNNGYKKEVLSKLETEFRKYEK